MYANLFFVVGFMGCGKTFWGNKLSQKFGLKWQDTDQEIERKYQQSIANIFSQQGEKVFRNYETDILHFLVQLNLLNNCLITTGGGMPCFNNNMEYMKSHGKVIWLDIAVEDIVTRLLHNQSRPLIARLNEKELENYVTEHLEKRKVFYQQAHHCVSNPKTVDDFSFIFSQPSSKSLK